MLLFSHFMCQKNVLWIGIDPDPDPDPTFLFSLMPIQIRIWIRIIHQTLQIFQNRSLFFFLFTVMPIDIVSSFSQSHRCHNFLQFCRMLNFSGKEGLVDMDTRIRLWISRSWIRQKDADSTGSGSTCKKLKKTYLKPLQPMI